MLCLDRPEIVSAPSAQQVVEGNGVILFCNATGNPQPNITWTKHGNNSLISTFETLNLTRLMRGDNGAVYKCKVENVVGSAEANAIVTMLCKCLSSVLEFLNKVVPASMYDHRSFLRLFAQPKLNHLGYFLFKSIRIEMLGIGSNLILLGP